MGKFLQLFKQTFIYGIATVFPRIISVVLLRLHTDKSVISESSEYGTLSLIFTYIVLFNVILSLGMETSFFRFYNKEKNKKNVLNTAAISIIISSILFASLFSIFKFNISDFIGISSSYLSIVVWILVVDVLTVIPFAYLRLKGSAFKYSTVKIINILVYFSLNIFLLIYLKDMANDYKILQCSASDSSEEIKKKYFKLVKEYHPDTLVSKGLPEEFLKFANERLANINKAYDRIIKYRKDNSV